MEPNNLSDDARAPLLRPGADDAARRSGGSRPAEDAPASEGPVVVERAADLLCAFASRLLRELSGLAGLLVIALALAAAAALAPARVVRAFRCRDPLAAAADDDATATAAAKSPQRDVPMPPGHARGVSLWAGGGLSNAARVHARVFAPIATEGIMGPVFAEQFRMRDGDLSSSFLEALRAAARAGDVVLLLPPTGGAAETFVWSGTVAALAGAGMFVVCLDLRGQGRSAAPAGKYCMQMLAADAAAALTRACGGFGVHVVGWSLGAGVGLQLALDHPELVRSLCLFGFSAAFGGGEQSAFTASAAQAAVASPRTVAALGVEGHGMLLAALMRFRGGGPSERMAARRAIHAANSLQGYAGTVSAWQPFDVTARLGRLRCPLRHLHTAGDGLCGHTAAKKARDCEMVVEGGGRASMRTQPGPWSHAWPFEHSPSFNAQVLAWLRGAGAQ